MLKRIRVFLLGTNASVFSFFRRHRQEFLILQREDEKTSLSLVGEKPHLVVLIGDDLHLCQQARAAWPTIPLVMVSANTSILHRVRALDLEADDYLTLPFGEGEFFARLRALIRRMHPLNLHEAQGATQVLTSQDGNLVLNLAEQDCQISGRKVRLTPTEFALLRVFLTYGERVLSHRFLLQQVWGPEYGEEKEYLRVYIRQLRRKIEEDPAHPRYLVTEPRVGYVFRKSPL